MNKKIAFIFPGQGAQYVAMGKEFYDKYDIAKSTFDEADEILGYKLSDIIFNGPIDKLSLTENAQLAIFVNSIAIMRTIQSITELIPKVTTGLSLGEYSALFAANKMSFQDCLILIQKRAKLMDESCMQHPGTMAVVLGLDSNKVEDLLGPLDNVWVANLNCPNQVVISGSFDAVEKASIILKENKAKRVIPLKVQGAFHSPFMEYAKEHLEKEIMNTQFSDSSIDLVMNVSASTARNLEEIKDNLIKQVTSPVLFEDSIHNLENYKIDLFLEIGCGKTLKNMLKKINPNLKCISIDKVEDLESLGDINA